MRRKLTAEERQQRKKARDKIVQVCNAHKMRSRMHPYHYPTLYGPRDIERAVFYARQHMLIDGVTMRQAGYQVRAVKPGRPTVLKRLLGER